MIEQYLDKQIGYVKINKPIVYHDNSFEVAAWWQERTSLTGVYPIYLRKVNAYSKDYIVVADVPSVISDDYFPALWAGVAIGNKPYVSHNIGSVGRDIKVSLPLIKAIGYTGNIPGSDINWYVNSELYKAYLDDRKLALNLEYSGLPGYYDKYIETSDVSDVRMIAHVAEKLVNYSREIEELERLIGYLEEKSDMWRELHKKNTSWINE